MALALAISVGAATIPSSTRGTGAAAWSPPRLLVSARPLRQPFAQQGHLGQRATFRTRNQQSLQKLHSCIARPGTPQAIKRELRLAVAEALKTGEVSSNHPVICPIDKGDQDIL